VTNVEIAQYFEDIADLLEIQGANPFRVRAYRNAARTIEEYPTQLRKLVAEGADLTELPTVGKDLAGYIEELLKTGRTKIYRDLTREVPASLIELTKLPGLGAKRVKKLWEELGIETLDDLERAAKDEEIRDLEGFGKKTEERILAGIAQRRKQTVRFKLADADQLVEPLIDYLKESKAVQQLEVAGSYRRRRETVGDIDLLVISDRPAEVMQRFTEYSEVAEVERSGDTRGTVILKSGLQVDLRILPPESYGAALQYFTGSKAHNVKFRTWAVARGLRVSEYGVFEIPEDADDEEGKRIAGKTEEDVYAALDLPWMPPEIREDRGELEAARDGQLPTLIELDDIRGDLQMHSTWSDGKNTIEEMLEGCVELGYEYLAMTDHSKALAMTGGLDRKKLKQQWKEIDALMKGRDDIRLLKGMEVDILTDGSLDLEDDMLDQLDVVLVSIHSKLDLPPAKQTQRIVKALEHPAVAILGHPTGRLINRREAMGFDLEEVLQCAAEHDVIVECNAHPDRLDLKDTHLMRAKELGLKVAISTDAHRVPDLRLIRYGVDQARRAWLGKDDVVNTWPLKRLMKLLNRTANG
jgi:DNA polymerase (family 10)